MAQSEPRGAASESSLIPSEARVVGRDAFSLILPGHSQDEDKYGLNLFDLMAPVPRFVSVAREVSVTWKLPSKPKILTCNLRMDCRTTNRADPLNSYRRR